MQQRCAQGLHAFGQHSGVAGDALRDALEAFGTVVDRVHAGHHRRQYLRGADVRCRFFAANVLLTRLQRQSVGGFAVHVHAHADQATGQGALVLVAAGHVGGVRTARAHGHAKALGGADHDVGAHLAGGFEQHQRHQVGGQNERCLLVVNQIGAELPVCQPAAATGVLVQGRKVVVLFDGGLPLVTRAHDLDRDAQRRSTGLDHLNGLRVAVAAHDEHVALGLDRALGQGHGFGGSRGFVEHGRVGNRHAGQVADHGLEVHQCLHAALRNLGLVGGVGGVPGGVFQNVAQDHARRVRAVIALADVAFKQAVLLRESLEFGQSGRFGDGRGQVHGLRAGDAARHDGFNQGAARGLTDHAQHVLFVGSADADVACDEFGRVFEVAKRAEGGHQHAWLRLKHSASGTACHLPKVLDICAFCWGSLVSARCVFVMPDLIGHPWTPDQVRGDMSRFSRQKTLCKPSRPAGRQSVRGWTA